jgi:hypothetical protein
MIVYRSLLARILPGSTPAIMPQNKQPLFVFDILGKKELKVRVLAKRQNEWFSQKLKNYGIALESPAERERSSLSNPSKCLLFGSSPTVSNHRRLAAWKSFLQHFGAFVNSPDFVNFMFEIVDELFNNVLDFSAKNKLATISQNDEKTS